MASPSPASRDALLESFTRALLLYSAARAWLAAIRPSHLDTLGLAALATAVSACAVLAFWPRRQPEMRRLGVRLVLAPLLVHLVWTFPLTDNHFFLELVCMLALACIDTRDDDGRELQLQALRWIVAIVLFHTGLQKLLWGTYLHGDFLAWMVATGSPFGDLFALILDDGQVRGLRAAARLEVGAGPFRVGSPLLLAASNGTVAAELLLPVGLAWRRTRPLAALAALAMVLLFQLAAREVLFACLFGSCLLLFLERDRIRPLLPVLALLYLYLLAVLAGFAPGAGLLRVGHV